MNDQRYLKSHDATFLEVSWERQMQLAGMERWDRNQYKKNGQKVDASSSDVGQKYIKRFHAEVEAAIEKAQTELVESKNQQDRRSRAACLMLPAETAALLTLKCLFDEVSQASNQMMGANLQTISKKLGKAVETELNFRHWIQESRADAREYAAENGLTNVPVSQAERIIKQAGVNRSTLSRWRKQFKELEEYEWNYQQQASVGVFLLTTTVSALSKCFEFHNATVQGKPKKHVRITEDFKTEFDQMGASICRFQVIKKPSLIKPQPWTPVIEELEEESL